MEHIIRCHDIAETNFTHAEECFVYDDTGKRYLDLEAGCWCMALGYNNPRINRVMADQMGKIIHLGTRYPNHLTERTAQALLSITGISDGKCVFLSSGSEAVEFAVQMARRLTAKPLLLTFTKSYLAAFGSAGDKVSSQWHLLDWSGCDSLDSIPFDTIGGFVFEPGGSGTEDVRFPEEQLVREIVRRIRLNGGVIIANEVTTGMGRTGKWFGYNHYELIPDIVAAGKCLGNGYPVSAVAMQRDLAQEVEARGFHYVQSHQNDPLGCAVAFEVITAMTEDGWIERGAETGRYFLEQLHDLGRTHAIVKEARGRGMLLAVEFGQRDGFSTTAVFERLFERGFLLAHSPQRRMFRFDPPLTLKKEDIDYFMKNLDEVLNETT